MQIAYLDSSVWIVRLEGSPIYRQRVKRELLALEQNGWKFGLSDAVVLETLLKPHHQQQNVLIDYYNQVFQESMFFPIFDDVFKNALEIAQRDNLKAMDAIHVAFAVAYDCQLFITTDPDFRNLTSMPLHLIDLSQAAPS